MPSRTRPSGEHREFLEVLGELTYDHNGGSGWTTPEVGGAFRRAPTSASADGRTPTHALSASVPITAYLDDSGHDHRGSGDSRDSSASQELATDIGALINKQILGLSERGLSASRIRAHLREQYGVDVSSDAIAGATDAVLDEMAEWQSRSLDAVYPLIFIDVLTIKIGDQNVATRSVYLAIGVDREGARNVLGMWLGGDGEDSGEFWSAVLGELTSRGVADVCIVCCDDVAGLSGAIGAIWPQAVIQLGVVGLIRASRRYASKKDRTPVTQTLRLMCTAVDEAAATAALDAFAQRWQTRYPATVRLWQTHWAEFTALLAFPPDVRRVIYTTDLIESLNTRLGKVTRNGGQRLSKHAALKLLYLALRGFRPFRDPTVGPRSSGWKQALQAFTIHFDGRIPAP